MEATTDDIADTETISNLAEVTSSSEEETTIVGEQSISEESISTNDVALGDSGTTTKRDETDSKKQEQTTTKAVTTQKPTTTKRAITTTQAPTTTTQQETTTEEETTTAPPRGANGVILEELTFYWLNQDPYTIPATWAQLVYERTGGAYELGAHGPMYSDVPKRIGQNALGNELLLYNQADGTGSTKEDVIAVYGQPLYTGLDPNTGAIAIYYRYLNENIPEEQVLYIRFTFSAKKTDYKISSILVANAENYSDDNYTEQQ